MKLDSSLLKQYGLTRPNTDCSLVCHAPTVNLNFEQNGNVRACCYNSEHVLGTWPAQSIRSIWEGASVASLRGFVAENNLGGGCLECGKMLAAGNFHGVRAKYYDEFVPNTAKARIFRTWKKALGSPIYPKVMEFEMSNKCNLECVMCNGYFSSSIRKNREKLPPIVSPYDNRFVDQLEEFLPYLTDAKFLGGEPFMIDIYVRIWERIREVNPNIRLHITTNGTFLTDRVKGLLEGLKAGIILSIDSVNRDTYHAIRVNGQFDKVMENLEFFRSYTKRKGTFISLAACPITLNWKELPDLLTFCLNKELYLYFNAVFSPSEYSLREMSVEKLTEVIHFLKASPIAKLDGNSRNARNMSIHAYTDFIQLLEGWLAEKHMKLHSSESQYSLTKVYFTREPIIDWNIDTVKSSIKQYCAISDKTYIDKEVALLNKLSNLLIDTPQGQLHTVFLCYFELLIESNVLAYNELLALEKAELLEKLVQNHAKRDRILEEMGKSDPITLASTLYTMNEEMLSIALETHFS